LSKVWICDIIPSYSCIEDDNHLLTVLLKIRGDLLDVREGCLVDGEVSIGFHVIDVQPDTLKWKAVRAIALNVLQNQRLVVVSF
jgi:hypothetical protein